MARRTKAQDRASLVRRGYDPAELAQFERDGAAGRWSATVEKLIRTGAERATVTQLDEQIAMQQQIARRVTPGTVAAFFYTKLVDTLRAVRATKATAALDERIAAGEDRDP